MEWKVKLGLTQSEARDVCSKIKNSANVTSTWIAHNTYLHRILRPLLPTALQLNRPTSTCVRPVAKMVNECMRAHPARLAPEKLCFSESENFLRKYS
jgi:hypothetical protein